MSEHGTNSRYANDGCRCDECKAAMRAYQAAYYAKNREAILASQRTYSAEHKQENAAYYADWYAKNREKASAYQAAYRAAHKEKVAAGKRAYYAGHREEILARTRAYAAEHKDEKAAYVAANPEKNRAYSRNRRARKRASEGTHTAADVMAQYERQRGRCYWCGADLGDGYHADHVVPLSKDGSNGPENIVVACPMCNLRKNNKHPMDWAGRLL